MMSKTPNLHIWLIAVATTLTIWSASATADIIYVDPNAPGIYVDPNDPGPVHNGNSWPKAYNYLQDALSDAEFGDRIRVASGSYRPDQDAEHPNGSNSTSATFKLENGVEIYGGYAGYGEPDPNARDTDMYESILTGVLSTKKSRHVVTGTGTNATAVLDGFTITGGNAVNTSGGGMLNNSGSPTLIDCLFIDNSTTAFGGGIYNGTGSAPTLSDCSFENNWATKNGGGLYNLSSSPTIRNCAFTGNSAGQLGGGLCNYDGSNPDIINCTFDDNFAGLRGGGIYNWSSTTELELINCAFKGNSAAHFGGAICNWNSTAQLFGCLFSGNRADLDGGAMYNRSYNTMVTNCTFSANEALGNGGAIFNELANPTIANCIFWANTDSSGSPEPAQIQGGLPQVTHSCIQDDNPNDSYVPFECPDCNNIDDDPMFVQAPSDGGDGWGDDPCTPAIDEGANDDFGDLHLLPGSPCIDAADNTMVPPDTHDLDDDLDTGELTPLDPDYNPRFIDDPATTNTGIPDPSHDPNVIVDMGAYEYQLVAEEKYCGGTGTAEDPYQICDPNHMQEIGANPEDWDKHFKLMADIDLGRYTGTQFNIIGYYAVGAAKPFTGIFDGNDHAISNFTYSTTEGYDIGLFGTVGGFGESVTAEIKNLGLINPNVDASGEYATGSLVGSLWLGKITNCYVQSGSVSGLGEFWGATGGLAGYAEGDITDCHVSSVDVSGTLGVGGLVGTYAFEMFMPPYYTVQGCSATGSVEGNSDVGGLVGAFGFGTISECYSTATVTAADTGAGGLFGVIGYNQTGTWGTISDCYARGNIFGNNEVGGLVGRNNGGPISNCYSAGLVEGTTYVGGFVGVSVDGSNNNCFWDSTINPLLPGLGTGDIDPNVIGETTENMQTETTYTDAGWDFVDESANGTEDIWKICNGAAYPRLWWEYRALDGDVNNDCQVNLVDLAIVSYQWLDEPGIPSADIAPPGGDGEVNSDDLLVVAANWLTGAEVPAGEITVNLSMDDLWMYQNVGSSTLSNLTATVSIVDDPAGNGSYSYSWEFILPGDVTVGPSTKSGGGPGDTSWNFASPNCNEPAGLSDLGQAFTVKVTVTGDDYANTGSAEAQFGIALLADVNNDTAVTVVDRSIINAFWRMGSAGSFTFKDCNVNSDDSVNGTDRSIANAVLLGLLGQNTVSQPCPFR